MESASGSKRTEGEVGVLRRPPSPPEESFSGESEFMGLRVVRIPRHESIPLVTERPTMIHTLRSEVVAMVLEGQELLLDSSTWASLPAFRRVRLRPLSHGARLFIATVKPELVTRMVVQNARGGMTQERAEKVLGHPQVLARTAWVYELVHRYWFERQACGGANNNEVTRFLETELLKELCYLGLEREQGPRASRVSEVRDVVARAREIVESDLFRNWRIAELARRAGASESTLLRAFKRELQMTPSAFLRERRLDESLALLESGRFRVSEVAARVGYASATTFAEAFRRRFGRTPSSVRR